MKDEYVIHQQPMLCGSEEAEVRRYKRIDIRKTIWLVADQENASDNVYSWHGPSEGFGGREITFTLTDGSKLVLAGPWHSSPEPLFGIMPELEYKYLTFGVIGMARSFRPDKIINILYMDDKPTIGKYTRIEELAQTYANMLKQTVYYYKQTYGGSSNGPMRCEI